MFGLLPRALLSSFRSRAALQELGTPSSLAVYQQTVFGMHTQGLVDRFTFLTPWRPCQNLLTLYAPIRRRTSLIGKAADLKSRSCRIHLHSASLNFLCSHALARLSATMVIHPQRTSPHLWFAKMFAVSDVISQRTDDPLLGEVIVRRALGDACKESG